MLVCDFRIQSRVRRGLLVLVAGIFSLSQIGSNARRMRQFHKTDAPEHVTAGAGSASLSATSPMVPLALRRASRVRASSWVRAPSSPRNTAALVDAPLRSVCRASPCCGKPYRTAPPTRPTPSLRPRSLPSIDAARSVPRDNGIRDSTWYHHHTRAALATQGSLGQDEQALRSRAFLAPAPSRAAAQLMITRKEIRCTRCHPKNKETIKLSIQPETR